MPDPWEGLELCTELPDVVTAISMVRANPFLVSRLSAFPGGVTEAEAASFPKLPVSSVQKQTDRQPPPTQTVCRHRRDHRCRDGRRSAHVFEAVSVCRWISGSRCKHLACVHVGDSPQRVRGAVPFGRKALSAPARSDRGRLCWSLRPWTWGPSSGPRSRLAE